MLDATDKRFTAQALRESSEALISRLRLAGARVFQFSWAGKPVAWKLKRFYWAKKR